MSESTPMRMTRVRTCLCGRSAVGWFTALVLSVVVALPDSKIAM